MLIIFTLIAAYVLLVLAAAAMIYNENKRNLKAPDHENKNVTATLLECEHLQQEGIDLFECHNPFVEVDHRYN